MTLSAACLTPTFGWTNDSKISFKYSWITVLAIPDDTSPISFKFSCFDNFDPADMLQWGLTLTIQDYSTIDEYSGYSLSKVRCTMCKNSFVFWFYRLFLCTTLFTQALYLTIIRYFESLLCRKIYRLLRQTCFYCSFHFFKYWFFKYWKRWDSLALRSGLWWSRTSHSKDLIKTSIPQTFTAVNELFVIKDGQSERISSSMFSRQSFNCSTQFRTFNQHYIRPIHITNLAMNV